MVGVIDRVGDYNTGFMSVTVSGRSDRLVIITRASCPEDTFKNQLV